MIRPVVLSMRRLFYVSLTALLILLATIFFVRRARHRAVALPAVEQLEVLRGLSCGDTLAAARQLTQSGAVVEARQAYLWMVAQCEEASVLATALLELGSVSGHLLQRPDEAARAYEEFLRRFPDRSGTDDALFHLAQIEIDQGQAAEGVAHLTALSERFPNSTHKDSAAFLASRATELVAAQRRRQRSFVGQLAALIPTNMVSLLALLAAIGPSIIQAVRELAKEKSGVAPHRRWVLPAILVGLTLLNYTLNNLDSARRNRDVMDKLDRLLATHTAVAQ